MLNLRHKQRPRSKSAPERPILNNLLPWDANPNKDEALKRAASLFNWSVDRPFLAWLKVTAILGMKVPSKIAASFCQKRNGSDFAGMLAFIIEAATLSSVSHRSTCFDLPSNKDPSLTIERYIDRFAVCTFAHEAVFLLTLIYLDRASRKIPVTKRNAHKLFAAAFVCASKFADDFFHTNRHYSQVAGVVPSDICRMEVAFLATLKFSLCVSDTEWEEYTTVYEQVRRTSATFGLAQFFYNLEMLHSQTL